jgi:hypothetical protein
LAEFAKYFVALRAHYHPTMALILSRKPDRAVAVDSRSALTYASERKPRQRLADRKRQAPQRRLRQFKGSRK